MNLSNGKFFNRKGFLQVFVLVYLLTFSFTSVSEKPWVNFTCEDDNTDRRLQEEPDSHLLLLAKAICLFEKGDKIQGLHYLKLAKRHGGVSPAYLIAFYLESDGTFKTLKNNVRHSEVLDITINAHQEVLASIAKIPNYPEVTNDVSYISYEARYHIKIHSTYSLARLNFRRYFLHFVDHNSSLLKSSPALSAAQASQLEFYPSLRHHLGPLYSLNNLESATHKCINTPYLKYWKRQRYNGYIRMCKLLKNFADEVKTLEAQRIQASKSCGDFVTLKGEACKEYVLVAKEIHKKILDLDNIIKKTKFHN